MFTGIVEEMGKIAAIKKRQKSSIMSVSGKIIFDDLKIGDSIAVNGVCLTVTSFASTTFTVDIMSETLSRSSLGKLKIGSFVNLERAMPSNGRFGGHIVSGHIDGTATISKIQQDDNAIWYTVKAAKKLMKYIVGKGSIAIDGISLTVVSVTNDEFSVSIIPHTAKETILSKKAVGDVVNIENDIIGKYVERLVGLDLLQKHQISKEFLLKAGF